MQYLSFNYWTEINIRTLFLFNLNLSSILIRVEQFMFRLIWLLPTFCPHLHFIEFWISSSEFVSLASLGIKCDQTWNLFNETLLGRLKESTKPSLKKDSNPQHLDQEIGDFLCAATAALAKWNIMLRSNSVTFQKNLFLRSCIRVKEKEAYQRISVRDKVWLQLSRNQMLSSFLEI